MNKFKGTFAIDLHNMLHSREKEGNVRKEFTLVPYVRDGTEGNLESFQD